MNPNSQNQVWSKWCWFVVPGRALKREFVDVKNNCARFGRKAFGTSSKMRIIQNRRGYLIEVLTEGHPVNDSQYVDYLRTNWKRFFISGFGYDTKVKMTVKLMAGNPQTGRPSDQMLILPNKLSIEVN